MYLKRSGPHLYTDTIKKEIRESIDSKDIHIVTEEDPYKPVRVHVLIIGPKETPFEKGFFYLTFDFSLHYPFTPPRIKLRTTGGLTNNPRDTIRDNSVFVNILGTWQGIDYAVYQTLRSSLLSIQSMMSEKPSLGNNITNGLGFGPMPSEYKRSDVSKLLQNYSQMMEYETIRVAVVGMLEDSSVDSYYMPQKLKDIMISNFQSNYQFYEELIESKMGLEGQPIIDPFHDPLRPETFEYKCLLQKLLLLKEKYSISDQQISGKTPQSKPKCESITGANETGDTLLKSNEIAAKMSEESEEPKPKVKRIDQTDSGFGVNQQLNEDNVYEPYSEEESDAEEQNQPIT